MKVILTNPYTEETMKIKNSIKLAMLSIVGSGLLISSSANSATVTANSSISVVTGVALTKNTDLDFGTVTQPTNGGTLTIAPNGTTSVTGDVVAPSTVTAANFTATGQSNTAVVITLPAAPINMTSGTNTISVGSFAHDAGTSPTLDATGSLTFNVGATATLAGGQATGAYTGTFDVTVTY